MNVRMEFSMARLGLRSLVAAVLCGVGGIAGAQDVYVDDPSMNALGVYNGIHEPLYPYDAPEPWLHGYFQQMPYYGGFRSFAPYNYKHVLSQSQTAASWGMDPQMPYSQQFWHKYHGKASMAPYEAFTASTDADLQDGLNVIHHEAHTVSPTDLEKLSAQASQLRRIEQHDLRPVGPRIAVPSQPRIVTPSSKTMTIPRPKIVLPPTSFSAPEYNQGEIARPALVLPSMNQ